MGCLSAASRRVGRLEVSSSKLGGLSADSRRAGRLEVSSSAVCTLEIGSGFIYLRTSDNVYFLTSEEERIRLADN